ncbi:MAG: hypothetical protein CM1200mP10_13540 [Candidatus Neomarinimicrobiota bacterium]|nr:MAG: hypothetical protein CM1200mP10_13540 [Candidatus Neomarinimicrobiota bacterium]
MVFTSFIFAQSTIEGTVSDDSGNPLAGANVTVEGRPMAQRLVLMVLILSIFHQERLMVVLL